MIEMVDSMDIEGRNLEGRYVLGGLSMNLGGKVCFPGTPLFVERSTAAGHHCRKILMPGIESGQATDAILVPQHWDDHSIRIRNHHIRFVCETSDEVVNLVNSQWAISEALKRRGYVSDDEIRVEILDIITSAMGEGEPSFQPALQ